ncbi:hypothetical protein, partial [Streptomyces sp. NPDC001137]|uniref:hypothetical protein n=1 Tax=Streptomyces sp. NPDC001137 TaxID=3154378 RepID=UPI00332FC356
DTRALSLPALHHRQQNGPPTSSTAHHESSRLAYENSEHSISRDSTRLSFLDSANVDMRFVRGKWQRIRYHTPESLLGLLSRYFEDVKISDTTRATVKAVCKRPRVLPIEEYRQAFSEEFNMPYPNEFRHNKHGGILDILIKSIEDRNSKLEG